VVSEQGEVTVVDKRIKYNISGLESLFNKRMKKLKDIAKVGLTGLKIK